MKYLRFHFFMCLPVKKHRLLNYRPQINMQKINLSRIINSTITLLHCILNNFNNTIGILTTLILAILNSGFKL